MGIIKIIDFKFKSMPNSEILAQYIFGEFLYKYLRVYSKIYNRSLEGIVNLINEVDEKYKSEDNDGVSMEQKKRKTKSFATVLGIIVLVFMVVGGYSYYKKFMGSQAFAKKSEASSKNLSKSNTEVNIEKDKNAKLNNKASVAKDDNDVKNSIDDEKKNLISINEAVKPFKIQVDLEKQRVYVYDAKSKLVQVFVCSSGIIGSDTPKGEYTIKERGYSFFSDKYKEGAYYWTQFKGNYLFHSVPFDKNQKIETNEEQKLGTKASHGCVRLAISDAKWIYDNIPRGTVVVIK